MIPPHTTEHPARINGRKSTNAVVATYSAIRRAYPEPAHIEMIASALWPDCHFTPETFIAIIRQNVTRSRPLIAPWKIENIYGYGYMLTPPSEPDINDE